MNLYWVNVLAAYEGEGEPNGTPGGTPGGDTSGAAPNQPEGGNPGGGQTFSKEQQDHLNRLLAEERRKTETKAEQKYKEKLEALENSYTEALNNKSLSETERENLEQQLEDLRARHRTKEQQLAHEKKEAEQKYQEQLEVASKKANVWEQRYTESTITRELQSAAVKHDAYNPEQVVVQLRNQTSLVEEMDTSNKPTGNLVPMVRMLVRNDDTGASEQLQMTPDEAVEYMKKCPERWGNFFKNNIREGIGSLSATGGALSGDGTVDVTKLTDDQYYKLREENPAALGLKHLQPRR